MNLFVLHLGEVTLPAKHGLGADLKIFQRVVLTIA